MFGFIFSKDAVEIKINQPGHLVIELSIDSTWINSSDQSIYCNPNLEYYFQPGFPIVPFWQEVFIGIPANADIRIFKDTQISLGDYTPSILESEKAKGMDFEIPIDLKFDGSFPKSSVRLIPTLNISGMTSSKIEIFPFSIYNNKLFVTKNISVHIEWDINKQKYPLKILSKITLNELSGSGNLKKSIENIIPEYQFSNNIAKILVDTSGWYKITNTDLMGKEISLGSVNTSTLRLWNGENELPLYINDGNDGSLDNDDLLIFYGEKNSAPEGVEYENNFYTDENVYWLTWGTGEGKRFAVVDASLNQPPNMVFIPENYEYITKIERDDEYVRIAQQNQYLLQNWDIIDHFFMSPSIIVGKPFKFIFELESPDTNSIKGFDFDVQVRGMTTNDHDVDILINDQFITNAKWSNRNNLHIEQRNIDCSYLKTGNNTLSIVLSPSDSTLHDLIYLNWYKIKYPKYFSTNKDYINFSLDSIPGQKTVQFEITGFSNSNILLFKNRESLLTNFSISNNDDPSEYLLEFQEEDLQLSSKYEAITYNNLLNVKKIAKENAINNRLSNIMSQYVVIAPDSFRSTLTPLVDFHNGTFVNVDEIYRQYNYGIYSPYAIKSFLQNIYEQNSEKLEYAVLAMNSNWFDWRKGRINKPPSIPTMFTITYAMGAAACDYWYSVFDDNYWIPKISVGRFPVSNNAELQSIVEKTMYHHNRGITNWDNNTLLIGGAEAGFRYQSESLSEKITKYGTFISRLYAAPSIPDSSFYGTKDTLLSHLNRGLGYINFVGHGGGAVWADNQLLHRRDIDEISNHRKLPFITSMTCFTGDFSFTLGLGNLMLKHENGGAIAWYGASGLGWNYNDYYLVNPLQDLLFSSEDLTIGEIINRSKTQYFLSYSDVYPEIAASQLFQYNILGDPAIKPKKLQKEYILITPLDPEPSESIEINFNQSPVDSIFYQIFLPNNMSKNNSTILENFNPAIVTIPDTLSKGIHTLNLAYYSNNQWYNSSRLFQVSGSYIDINSIVPENPTNCDSINVIAEVSDRNGVSIVQLLVNNEYWSDMVKIDDNLYSLQDLIPPKPSGTNQNFTCRVIDASSDTTYSLPYNTQINDIPDISPINGKFYIDDEINIIVDIESITSTPVSASIELYILKNEQWELMGLDTVNFSGIETKEAIFRGYYPTGTNTYKVISIVNFTCAPTDNNSLTFDLATSAFWVTPELGSTGDGQNHSKIGIKNVEIDISSGLVETPKIIQINPLTDVLIPSQPDFKVINTVKDYMGIEVSWNSDAEYFLDWIVGPAPVSNKNELYKYIEDYHTWLPIDYSMTSDSTILVRSNGPTKFAFLENLDTDKPIITTNINGRKYLKNIYLSKNPIIVLDIYDKNGIDFRSDSIEYWINNDKTTSLNSEISGGGNNLNILINPTFTELDSSLSFLVRDAAGNHSDTLNLTFRVSEKMDLRDYGNYPNPFSDNTIFAYELTEEVEKLSFIIYTVDGRKIRQLDYTDIISGPELNISGYHEIEWDGKNQDGHDVANGNYFYLIRAKNEKTVVEKSGKILKVK